MPRNNTWAVIGAVLTTIAVFVLTDLLTFLNSGAIWPADMNGWLHLIVPSLIAGVLATLTPHYSLSERATGFRVINTTSDAPVIDANPSPVIVSQATKARAGLPLIGITSPANPTPPDVPPDIAH